MYGLFWIFFPPLVVVVVAVSAVYSSCCFCAYLFAYLMYSNPVFRLFAFSQKRIIWVCSIDSKNVSVFFICFARCCESNWKTLLLCAVFAIIKKKVKIKIFTVFVIENSWKKFQSKYFTLFISLISCYALCHCEFNRYTRYNFFPCVQLFFSAEFSVFFLAVSTMQI